MSIFSLYPVFISILFYLFFNQKLVKSEILGVLCCAISIVLLSLSKINSQDIKFPPIFPVALFLIVIIIMGMRSLMIRWELQRTNQNSSADLLMNLGTLFTGVLILLISFFYYFPKYGMNRFEIIAYRIPSGLIDNVSEVFAMYANSLGKGGAASALVETSAMIQTLIDIVFLK